MPLIEYPKPKRWIHKQATISNGFLSWAIAMYFAMGWISGILTAATWIAS